MAAIRLILLLISFIFVRDALFARFDTSAVAQKLNALSDIESHRKFWAEIRYRDQELRSTDSIEVVDEWNLIACSMYFNRFGYPKRSEIGADARIGKMVWVHNRSKDLDRLTFPIILSAFRGGEIPEKDLREYFLRSLYLHHFDDDKYLHAPLGELFKTLEVNVSDHINIADMLESLEAYHLFINSTRHVIGTWKTADFSRTYLLNGQEVYYDFQGLTIQIFRNDKGDYYYAPVYSDGSSEPIQLEPLNSAATSFGFVGVNRRDTFHILPDGILKQIRKDSEVIYHMLNE